MKKLIAISVLFFAFTLSGVAQEKMEESNPSSLAKKEAYLVKDFLKLEDSKVKDLYRLLEHKHNMFLENKSEDSRKQVSAIILAKLEATLNSAELEKLKKNKVLLNDLLD
jgi:CHASE1-domain containing sensor protein